MPGKASAVRGRILVLADDLTGALEAGAKFAGQGIASRVVVESGEKALDIAREVTALVVDTETRHVASGEAERRVYELARAAITRGFGFIYKKTDSTLRGNIGSELRGLLDAWPGSGLLYAPAYPKMGRTVKQGILQVDGQPVSATDFSYDALNPIAESSLVKLLESSIALPIVSIGEGTLDNVSGQAVCVCDADSDEEVERIASYFVESGTFSLAAGPSAFLHYLAREMNLHRSCPVPLPHVQRVLIVSGSRNKVSLDQIQYAEEASFPVIDSAGAASQTKGNIWWILRSGSQPGESSEEAASRLANKVLSVLIGLDIDGLVIFGGDTAYAVMDALGQTVMHPIGEVLEGIPVSRIRLQRPSGVTGGIKRDLVLITKAGGFGPRNVLPMIRDALA